MLYITGCGMVGGQRGAGDGAKPESTLKKKRPLQTHFFTADAKLYTNGKRTLCEFFVPLARGRHLREATVVTCERCMVVKDAWLEQPRRKPLTVRRLRILMRAAR